MWDTFGKEDGDRGLVNFFKDKLEARKKGLTEGNPWTSMATQAQPARPKASTFNNKDMDTLEYTQSNDHGDNAFIRRLDMQTGNNTPPFREVDMSLSDLYAVERNYNIEYCTDGNDTLESVTNDTPASILPPKIPSRSLPPATLHSPPPVSPQSRYDLISQSVSSFFSSLPLSPISIDPTYPCISLFNRMRIGEMIDNIPVECTAVNILRLANTAGKGNKGQAEGILAMVNWIEKRLTRKIDGIKDNGVLAMCIVNPALRIRTPQAISAWREVYSQVPCPLDKNCAFESVELNWFLGQIWSKRHCLTTISPPPNLSANPSQDSIHSALLHTLSQYSDTHRPSPHLLSVMISNLSRMVGNINIPSPIAQGLDNLPLNLSSDTDLFNYFNAHPLPPMDRPAPRLNSIYNSYYDDTEGRVGVGSLLNTINDHNGKTVDSVNNINIMNIGKYTPSCDNNDKENRYTGNKRNISIGKDKSTSIGKEKRIEEKVKVHPIQLNTVKPVGTTNPGVKSKVVTPRSSTPLVQSSRGYHSRYIYQQSLNSLSSRSPIPSSRGNRGMKTNRR